MDKLKEQHGNSELSKTVILDLLAQKLNCAREDVSFLFEQTVNNAPADFVKIPDTKFHSF